jgi:hypothetical protein
MTTINSVGTTLAGQTGTGLFVGSIAPTLGVVTATSINFGGSTLANYVSTTSWTPVATFVTQGNLSVAYGAQQGTYIRIGSMVIVTWVLQFIPTYTTASGTFEITGLPIVSTGGGTAAYYGTCFSGAATYPAGTTNLTSVNLSSTSIINIYGAGSAVPNAAFTTIQLPTAGNYTLSGSLTYFV